MDFDRRIEEKAEDITSSLQELIRIRSVEDLGGGKPFGEGVHKCLETSLALCQKLGFKTVNLDNMVGYCEYGEGEEMVAVVGHLDVVPEGDGWTYPPYGAEIHDGRIYGRGTVDDKGPTIASIYALDALRASGVALSRRVRIIFGLNEETGDEDMTYYLEHGGEIPVMGFTPDGEYPIINGEKGIINATYHKEFRTGGARVLHVLRGGIAANVVPEYAYAEIGCTQEDADDFCKLNLPQVKFSCIEGGVKAEAWGENAHGSTPWKGENAISRLLLALGHVGLDGDAGEFVTFMNRNIAMETRGESMGIYLEDALSGSLSLNLGVVEGNEEGVSVTLNVRYPVTSSYEACIPAMEEKLAAAGLQQTAIQHKSSIYMPPESELIKKLSKVYEEKTGEKTKLLCIGGGTYAKCIPNIVAFGPIFPGDEVREHKPDEYIEIKKLVKNTKIIAAAMYELAK